MAGIKQATFLDYDGFIDKFKPRKTTDDCYTPPNAPPPNAPAPPAGSSRRVKSKCKNY